jgi:hypothetical protein
MILRLHEQPLITQTPFHAALSESQPLTINTTPSPEDTMSTNSTTVTNYDENNQGLFPLDPPHPKWEREYGAPDLE